MKEQVVSAFPTRSIAETMVVNRSLASLPETVLALSERLCGLWADTKSAGVKLKSVPPGARLIRPALSEGLPCPLGYRGGIGAM